MSIWFAAISFFPELSMGLHLLLNANLAFHARTRTSILLTTGYAGQLIFDLRSHPVGSVAAVRRLPFSRWSR